MSETNALELVPTDDPLAWTFTVVERWCAGPHGRPFLFGGVTLALAVAALERSIGQPVIWLNVQYHDFAVPGAIIHIRVVIDVQGYRFTQARVVATVDHRRIVTAQGTLGGAVGAPPKQLAESPAVDRPDAYPIVRDRRVFQPGINNRFEFRLVDGDYPDGRIFSGETRGRVILWVRALEDERLDRPTLGIIADYVSIAVCDAAGGEVGSNSLDNTVRFIAEDDGCWALVVMEVDALAQGVAHGHLKIFSRRGLLLATASTSLALRGS